MTGIYFHKRIIVINAVSGKYELSYLADPDQRQLQKLMVRVRAARAAERKQGR